MPDSSPSNGNGTCEGIAYQLFLHVMFVERRNLHPKDEDKGLSRNLILDAYAQCLEAVKGTRETRQGR